MELNYDNIMKFMQDYFVAFGKYGQDPKNIHKMDDYFAPDLVFNPYVAGVGHVNGREEFYKVLCSHPSGLETLKPDNIMVDVKKASAVVLISAQISDPKTGEVLVKKKYFVLYPLMLDEKKTIKIKSLQFFWEVLPKGAMEIDDVFDRDRKKK